MKIIQSLWLNDDKGNINYNAGWLDTKYHLMSWALSYSSLSKQTRNIELISDDAGANLLTNLLGLDYNKVNTEFESYDNPLANRFWALKKIHAFSNQHEAFIHIDSDVFYLNIESVLNKLLIGQNYECNFSFCHPVQTALLKTCKKFKGYLKSNIELNAINTGIIGGTDYQFFNTFEGQVNEFIADNEDSILRLYKDYNILDKYLNVWLEQYFLHCFSKHSNKKFEYYLNNILHEDDYRNLADFPILPKQNQYFHLMYLTKINTTICEQLAQRLYIESPELYFRTLEVSRRLKSSQHYIVADTPTYRLPFERTCYMISFLTKEDINILGDELNEDYIQATIININNDHHKMILEDVYNYEKSTLNFIKNLPDSSTLWESWKVNSITINKTLGLPKNELIGKTLKRSEFCRRIESEWNWAEVNEYQFDADKQVLHNNLEQEPAYFEVVLYMFIHENIIREHLLDPINILILDFLDEPHSIIAIIDNVCNQIVIYQPQTNLKKIS